MIESVLLPIICSVAIDRAVPDSVDPNHKLKQLRRDKEISEALDPLETEFNKILKNRIQQRADEIESYHLHSLAMNWDTIDEHIDPNEVVYKKESEAIDWLVNQITNTDNVDLDDEAEQELRQILAAELANIVDSFTQLLSEDDQLRNQFQTEIQVNIRQELGQIHDQFEQLSEIGPISRFLQFDPREIDDVISMIEPPRAVDFVSRPEVDDIPDAKQLLIVGVAGSGKTRVIEKLLQTRLNQVDLILTPDPNESLFRQDQYAFERESFDGDVLLVWDDIHKINENQDNVIFEDVVSKLRSRVAEDGQSLFVIAAARSGHISELPGSVRSATSIDNRNEGFWGEFQTLELDSLPQQHTRRLIKRMGQEPDPPITFTPAALDKLAERASHESGPGYIDAAIKTADRGVELTFNDVETLPDEAIDIWVHQYEDLMRMGKMDKPSPPFEVLVASKLLYDLELEYYGSLVYGICKHVLHKPKTKRAFQTALNQLVERRWISVENNQPERAVNENQNDSVGTSVTGEYTKYKFHDTQLEAVDNVEEATTVSLANYKETFSEFLFEHAEDHCPNPKLTSVVHGEMGSYLLRNNTDYKRMKRHYQRAVESSSTTAVNKSNYGFVLHQEGKTELAETYYREALIDKSPTTDPLDSSQTLAHLNYANLLKDTNRPTQAKQHYNRALETISDTDDYLNSISHRIHVSFANLLKEESEFDLAEYHLQRALELTSETESIIDSTYQTGHEKYADLIFLQERYSDAKKHYRRVLEISSPTDDLLKSEKHIIHNNFAGLLQMEGELALAEKHYRRALQITAENDDPLNSEDSDMQNDYGVLLLNDDRPNEAVPHFKKAVVGWAESNQLRQVLETFDLLISACVDADNYEKAHSYCQSKLDLAKRNDLPTELINEIKTRCDSLATQDSG